MRHPVLFGEYELTIDEKNRLLVPAEVRKSISSDSEGERFFCIIGKNRVPWFYPERYYEDLVSQSPPDMTPGDELLEFDQLNFAMADRIYLDKQGRVVIPDRTIRRTGLGRDVTLIGVRDHLELWNRADWENRREALFARAADIAVRARQARKAP